jgi:hypothetical protein
MKLFRRFALVLCLFLGIATFVHGASITFDEFPADSDSDDGGEQLSSTRYSYLGVTFIFPDDGGTVGGVSNGDPGNWGLDGTNGPIFSGFNGSYSMTMLFTGDVFGFSLDASRANGSSMGNELILEGWKDGALIESTNPNFGLINQWNTLSLTNTVDEVRWLGSRGSGSLAFHSFGVDNIQWTNVAPIPEPSTMLLFGTGLAGLGLWQYRKKCESLSRTNQRLDHIEPHIVGCGSFFIYGGFL